MFASVISEFEKFALCNVACPKSAPYIEEFSNSVIVKFESRKLENLISELSNEDFCKFTELTLAK